MAVTDFKELVVDVTKALKDSAIEVTDEVEEIAVDVAKEAVKQLKEISPKKTGVYAKSWKIKKEKGELGKFSVTIYNQKKGYLTHLLEHGHAIHGGTGRAKAIPHISIAEKTAVEKFEKRLKRL